LGAKFAEEEFAMQPANSDDLEQSHVERLFDMIQEASAERRLRGLSPEQRVAGLSKEDAAKLLDLLKRMQGE
jgi:hypothetical protein